MVAYNQPYNLWQSMDRIKTDLEKLKERLEAEKIYPEQAASITWACLQIEVATMEMARFCQEKKVRVGRGTFKLK